MLYNTSCFYVSRYDNSISGSSTHSLYALNRFSSSLSFIFGTNQPHVDTSRVVSTQTNSGTNFENILVCLNSGIRLPIHHFINLVLVPNPKAKGAKWFCSATFQCLSNSTRGWEPGTSNGIHFDMWYWRYIALFTSSNKFATKLHRNTQVKRLVLLLSSTNHLPWLVADLAEWLSWKIVCFFSELEVSPCYFTYKGKN